LTCCIVCARPVEGAAITAPAIGGAVHPACLAERLPHDAVGLTIAVLALVLAPLAVVYGG
jgi:hypothetical protein